MGFLKQFSKDPLPMVVKGYWLPRDDEEPMWFDVAEFKTATDKAVLVHLPDLGEDVWFPLSQVEVLRMKSATCGVIVVSPWIANQKGLY